MFDPFAEKAFDVHSVAMLRALPVALMSWLARQRAQTHTVLGDSDETLVYTPAEMNGLRALNETRREE
ncbi:MAG: hypothetical protein HY234_10670 [Acidobacteria bacterium]|nr:hypothetical protein [Acidobacteriota bacterium]